MKKITLFLMLITALKSMQANNTQSDSHEESAQ